MARQVLGALTTLNLATNLDPMFSELYGLREIISSPGYTASTPRMTFDATTNIAMGGTPISNGAGTATYTINGSTMAAVELTLAGAQRGTIRTTDSNTLFGNIHSAPVNFIVGGSNRLTVANASVYPGLDNGESCGLSGNRWSVVYAATGSINTSDAREKTKVSPLTDDELSAAIQLGREIGAFKFLDAMQAKGDSARIHIGMTVQRAIEIMQDHRLDPFGYAFICYDKWDAREVAATFEQRDTSPQDKSGAPLMEMVETAPAYTTPAGDRYGFRMDQLLSFIARGQTERQDRIEQRLADLEK